MSKLSSAVPGPGLALLLGLLTRSVLLCPLPLLQWPLSIGVVEQCVIVFRLGLYSLCRDPDCNSWDFSSPSGSSLWFASPPPPPSGKLHSPVFVVLIPPALGNSLWLIQLSFLWFLSSSLLIEHSPERTLSFLSCCG